MRLDVSLPWPLCLVVSQEVLSSYNAIFQFLLAVKRVGDLLKDSWAVLVQVSSDIYICFVGVLVVFYYWYYSVKC
jgi:hypothetical protein